MSGRRKFHFGVTAAQRLAIAVSSTTSRRGFQLVEVITLHTDGCHRGLSAESYRWLARRRSPYNIRSKPYKKWWDTKIRIGLKPRLRPGGQLYPSSNLDLRPCGLDHRTPTWGNSHKSVLRPRLGRYLICFGYHGFLRDRPRTTRDLATYLIRLRIGHILNGS